MQGGSETVTAVTAVTAGDGEYRDRGIQCDRATPITQRHAQTPDSCCSFLQPVRPGESAVS
ncbi:hypothetical protein GCM10022235_05250 [Kribbella ginsengisoli]|uniref:Uncharacterized protein n=1 Tax=Kribbella ginsengisoli TaxID=363865 RepID=A0ABP6VVY9_9ACTN